MAGLWLDKMLKLYRPSKLGSTELFAPPISYGVEGHPVELGACSQWFCSSQA